MKTSIGQQIRQAREARSLSLEDVARATHMRVHYLQAIEDGNFESLPSQAQARGFLRSYASYLNLNAEALLKALEEPVASPDAPSTDDLPPTTESTPDQTISEQPAAEIFIEIGQRLQRQRELLGLSLDDVERHTHLRRHYMRALEAGDLDSLPSPVQGRGMLNNYATFLGLDPDPLLLRFADGLQARLAARQAAREEISPKTRPIPKRPPLTLPPGLRRLFSSDILIGSTITLFLIGFVLWGAIRIFTLRSEQPAQVTAPSISNVLLATPSPTSLPKLPETDSAVISTAENPALETPAAEGASQNSVVSPPSMGEATSGEATTSLPGPTSIVSEKRGVKVQIYITVRQRAWIRVTVDGKKELEGRVLPGNAYSFAGAEKIEILTGSGSAIQVFYNQQDLGPLGGYGQVINRIFTAQGVLTPTPTITPTASPTPRVTPTSPAKATPAAPAGTPTRPAIP